MSARLQVILASPRREWRLALHVFFAFFILSYFVKGFYFILIHEPLFSLGAPYPKPDKLWAYMILAMGVSTISAAIIWWSYHAGSMKLQRLFAQYRVLPLGQRERLVGWVGVLLAVGFVWVNSDDIINRIRGGIGAILARQGIPDPNEFYSGALGIRAFFFQIMNSFMIVFTVYAVMRRRVLLILLSYSYFLATAILSNGSRFTLVSSLLMIPLLLYLKCWREPSHRRAIVIGIYGTVLVVLPFVAGVLGVARSTGSIAVEELTWDAVISLGLVTFDSIDHLTNYLYLLPIDWTGVRSLEELWQLIPRAAYQGKPFLYGMLALQEQMYPGVIGGYYGAYVYGHYPLSSVVMGLDFFFLIGLAVHSIITGFFLALLDVALARGTLLPTSLFVTNVFFLYHIIRAGIVNFLLGGLPSILLAFLLAAALSKISNFRLASTRNGTKPI